MTDPAPESTPPSTTPPPPNPAPPAPTPPKPGDPPPKTDDAENAPPWGDDENFTPKKAWELIQNLRKEKGVDAKALEEKLAAQEAATEARNKALAAALGLTEAPKDENDLAETVKSLQAKFEASEREATKLRIAAEAKVPPEFHHLLTETDEEKLKTQAEMAAEYARLKAQAEGTPQFQPNPGQGQGGGSPTQEQLEAAEYEQFYPTPK